MKNPAMQSGSVEGRASRVGAVCRVFFWFFCSWLIAVPCRAATFVEVDSFVAFLAKYREMILLTFVVIVVMLATQVAFALANLRRRRAERQLAAIHDNSLVGIILFDGDRIIRSANQRACDIFGWSAEELQNQSSRAIHVDEEHYKRFGKTHLERLRTEDVMQVEWPFRTREGRTIWCQISGRALFPPDLTKGVVWVHDDITERKRDLERLRESENLTGVLFRIANAMQHTDGLDELFHHIHAILHEDMNAPNFFAALVDREHDRVEFPYFADEWDKVYSIENISDTSKETLTLQVIRTGERLVVRRDEISRLRSQRQFQSIGTPAAIWAGVPLTVRGRVVGAMAVQHYSDPDAFGERELRLLEAAADQVGMALERKQAADALRRSEEKFRALFENMRDGIARVNLEGRILECNRAFQSLLGYSETELKCLTYQDITPPEWHEVEALIVEAQVLVDGYSDIYEKEYVTRQGRFVPVELRTHMAMNDEFQAMEMWSTVRDVTDRKQMENELKRQALHDPLTGLANRTLCQDRLRQCMERSRRRLNYYYAVIFVDLDRFKVINDSLGHSIGDQLLVEVGHRLMECVRELDTVCRYGGDEFVVLLEELDSPRKAIQVVKRMRSEIRKTFQLGEKEVHITASIGIVLGPMENASPEDVLQNSNIALHRAKDTGRDRFKVFTGRMLDHAVHLLTLENDLAAAIGSGQFSVHFQPIVNLQNGSGLYGFEALARWDHPEQGSIPPEEFIPVAEESGVINDLGMWVLHKACSIMAGWRERHPGAEHLMLAVNISGRQFSQVDLVPQVRRILKKTGMPADRLKLEITETAIMENAVQVADRLRQLKDLGITLSIDDFGTGYSSMSYLQRLPVDNLKIDLSFVRRIDQTQEDVEIVRAIIGLAHSLGMCVVAEGVENIEHQEILAELGCEYGQGFLYSRPVAEDQAKDIVLEDLAMLLKQ